MKFSAKVYSKPGFLRKKNPFNSLLRRRLHGILGAALTPPAPIVSPVIDQGHTNECTVFESCGEQAAVTGKVYNTDAYWKSECDYLGYVPTDGVSFKVALATSTDPGYTVMGDSQPTEKNSFSLYIYPIYGKDMYDAIDYEINLHKRPVALSCMWRTEWTNGVNGIAPDTNSKLESGGHMTMANGKTNKTLHSQSSFPESDRMTNQNSWGVNAPGSDSGFYYFTRHQVNTYFNAAIRIDSTDKLANLLGLLSAKYVKLLSRLGL